MLFVNEKYKPLSAFFEEDEIINEATEENSRGLDLSKFLTWCEEIGVLREITDYLCDEIAIKESDDYSGDDGVKRYWQDNKSGVTNKYMIKSGTVNGVAKICDTPNVSNGTDDLKTVLDKYSNGVNVNGYTVQFDSNAPWLSKPSKTSCKLSITKGRGKNKTTNYVYFDIDKPTGKDALHKGGNGGAMELYIAFAYNKNFNNEYKNADIKNVYYVSGLKESNSDKVTNKNTALCRSVIDYYNKNSKWLDGIANSINEYFSDKSNGKLKSLRKLPNSETSKSSSWKGKDNTPKTDLISDNGKYKLSLKKADTGAQAMSGSYDEAMNTVTKVLNRMLQDPDKVKNSLLKNKLLNAIKLAQDKTITDLKTAIKNLKESDIENADVDDNTVIDVIKNVLFKASSEVEKSGAIDGWVTSPKKTAYIKSIINDEMQKSAYDLGVAAHQELSRILFAILDVDDDFKEAIIREALTGEIKFGSDSLATANYTLSWQEGVGKCVIEDIYDYIKAKAKYITSTINFKGSEGKSYTAMRLTLPKTTVDKELERIKNAAIQAADTKKAVNIVGGDKSDQQNNTPTQDSNNSEPAEAKPRKTRKKIK